jgi:very-short-patch-repair endonuclease
MRSADLLRPFHGVRTRADLSRVEAYAPLLRSDERFSHTTAAMLWGAPVPRTREAEVHVTATRSTRARTAGCVGHVSSATSTRTRSGFPVSDPAQTLIECGTLLHLDALVAVADHLILEPRVLDPNDVRPHITREALGNRLALSRGHGVRAARRAWELSREGVESPMETRLRLMLGRAGFPEPVCGYELHRADGSGVGWFDLAWPERRVIAEYDGDQHRTSTWQYEKDIRRYDEATELGWRVVRVRLHGIREGSADTIARVRRALA